MNTESRQTPRFETRARLVLSHYALLLPLSVRDLIIDLTREIDALRAQADQQQRVGSDNL